MSGKNYKRFDYNADHLAEALSNEFLSPNDIKVRKKRHYEYFLDYLGSDNDGMDAKTIVIEEKYLSRSFLYDYSIAKNIHKNR